jgi:hypothetical protein
MRFARPAPGPSAFVFALAPLVTWLTVACSQHVDSASPDAAFTADAASAPDSSRNGPEAGGPDGASLPDARYDASEVADSGGDVGSTPLDAATPEAGDPAADCLQAGSPPDGGDPSSNSYMESCGGAASPTIAAAGGNPCTIGVVGQHCFLQCAFCNGIGSSPPSSLVLPCTLPISNCCGVLTCGGCEPCN